MTIEEINKKIKQCTVAKRFIQLQIFGAIQNNDINKLKNRKRALVETIDELNRLQNLK